LHYIPGKIPPIPPVPFDMRVCWVRSTLDALVAGSSVAVFTVFHTKIMVMSPEDYSLLCRAVRLMKSVKDFPEPMEVEKARISAE